MQTIWPTDALKKHIRPKRAAQGIIINTLVAVPSQRLNCLSNTVSMIIINIHTLLEVCISKNYT